MDITTITGPVGHALGLLSTYAAFDLTTGLSASIFGWQFTAGFGRQKKISWYNQLTTSILRGASIKGTFLATLKWLTTHSFSILIGATLAYVFVVFIRVILQKFFKLI